MRAIPFIALVLLLLSGPAAATPPNQVDAGVRAIAMGGAFVAVANDATAVRWNPAAIAALQRQEIDFAYADHFGLGLKDSYFSYVLPMADNHALGLDWSYRGFDDVRAGLGLKNVQNQFGFAYGYRNGIQRLRRWVGNASIGVNGKYLSQSTDLDGTSAMSATGLGLDLGLLVPLPGNLRLGLVAQDLGGTSVKHKGGLSEKLYQGHYRLGLAYRPLEGLMLSSEVDDHFRLGAEYWLAGQLALRAGVKTERKSPDTFADATTASFGVGLKYRFAELDYAYERHPVLGATHYTSLSLSYNPRVVSIKDATIRPSPVFRSQYPHYQESDFFGVVLGNSAQEPVRATVSLFLPRMMSTPHQEEVLLPPQSSEKYTFKVTFDPDLFNQPEATYDNFVNPVIQVRYSRNGQEQLVERSLDRVYVAGKNKLSWNEAGMVAAFVTPADLAVAGLARGLVQRYDGMLAAKFNRGNIGKAALIFDALGVYKIRYQADQKLPFASIAADKTIFDTVQYPSELLDKPAGVDTKIGDCDDLAVLYASLLENLSIDTAFLEANDPGKGHIYLMFDSGIPPDRAADQFTSSAEYVEWQGRVWIPVETTMFGFTFADAWRNGVAEYKVLKIRKLINELYTQQWMQTYKAPTLPSVRVELPAAAALDSLLAKDLAFFDQRIDQIAMGLVTSLDTPEGAYEAAVAYLRINHLEKALGMFDRSLALKVDHADALNGKGVVFTHQGRYDEALELYNRALQLSDDNGIRMNIALTYYLKGEREQADKLFEQVKALDASYGELFDFLATVGDAQQYYEIGVNYLRQLRLDQALEQFELALGADPQYADALNAKGVVLTRKGQYAEARPLFEQAADLVPDQSGFRLNVALAYHLQGDRAKAEVIFKQLTTQDESYAGLLDFLAGAESSDEGYHSALAYVQQDQFDKALEYLDQVLQLAPEMADALNLRGVVLARKGQYEEAYAAFARAAELEPANPGIQLNMAIMCYVQGRREEAVEIYRKVIEQDSRYQGLLDILDGQ
ncbi:MAG: tetratricopeptide repeat protein [Candidatus Latescibacteria bacterium]|nr:tetratricopeptide repeat protein [Candidatus Latescibacterota bacterium]